MVVLPRPIQIQVCDAVKKISKSPKIVYNAPELVGSIIDYNTIENDHKDISGYYDQENKVIALSNSKDLYVIFHEIGHEFQYKEYGDEAYYKQISNCLWFEQQADRISFEFFRRLGFGGLEGRYFDVKGSIEFLSEYFQGFIPNDLTQCLN